MGGALMSAGAGSHEFQAYFCWDAECKDESAGRWQFRSFRCGSDDPQQAADALAHWCGFEDARPRYAYLWQPGGERYFFKLIVRTTITVQVEEVRL